MQKRSNRKQGGIYNVNEKRKPIDPQILRILQILVRPHKYVHQPKIAPSADMGVRLSCEMQMYEEKPRDKGRRDLQQFSVQDRRISGNAYALSKMRQSNGR